jgi:hypothetical protein
MYVQNGITRLREKGFSFISENIQNKSENTLCITDYVQDPAGLFTLLELLISRHYIPLEETFFIQNINKVPQFSFIFDIIDFSLSLSLSLSLSIPE